MLKHQPKTLARTLEYIAIRSPGEYGLFWDPDGAMPWKEFYWALQEDPSLRFVRESTVRELGLLGMELPFVLDGSRLRLVPETIKPEYPAASEVPERLYLGLRPKNMVYIQKNGLHSAGKRLLALCSERELALRIAKRREQAPILIEILAREASGSGLSFFVAGPHLYLAESVPVEFIVFPKIRRDLLERPAERVPKREEKPSPAVAPGSFTVQPHHLQASQPSGKGMKKDARSGWKKDSRKERHKRDL
ncbi:MAG: hypothetical protein ABSE08_08465 [Syntrophobacteraceae bacterium]|jgi:putative RNA 2'-phosphotransferase